MDEILKALLTKWPEAVFFLTCVLASVLVAKAIVQSRMSDFKDQMVGFKSLSDEYRKKAEGEANRLGAMEAKLSEIDTELRELKDSFAELKDKR